MVGKDIDMDKRERWEKIGETKYNKWNRRIKGKEIPGYLKKGWGEARWQRVARFRLGYEIKERWYWKKEEERKNRMCGYKREKERCGSMYGRNV